MDKDILNPCLFCKRSNTCSDKTMITGLKKLIQEVAPGLRIGCSNFDSTLSNKPEWMDELKQFKIEGVDLL